MLNPPGSVAAFVVNSEFHTGERPQFVWVWANDLGGRVEDYI